MITDIVAGTVGVAALLLAAMVVTIARSESRDTDPPDDPAPEPEPQPAQDDALTVEFTALRTVLFTAEGDVYAATAPPVRSKHHHDTVEFVALDYLIPNAFAARIGPRLKYPVAA